MARPSQVRILLPALTTFIAVVTFARDAPVLPRLLEHLKAQDDADWSLHIVDTTRAGDPGAEPYFLRIRQLTAAVLPGKEVVVEEYGAVRQEEPKWERVANARNILRERFLASDATHLLFLDSDVMLPPHALRLLRSHDAPAVSGVYLNVLRFQGTSLGREVLKVSPVAWIKDHADPEHLARPLLVLDVLPPRVIPILFAGFGCVLLSRAVLAQIPIALVRGQVGTEDIPFYRELDRHGIPLILDTRVKCAHVRFPPGDERNKVLDFANYQMQLRSKGR